MAIRRRNVTFSQERKNRHAEIRKQVEADKPRANRQAKQIRSQMEAVFDAMQVLKAEREKRGISLGELSRITGIDRANLSRLENDINANPTLETLVRIAQAIGGRIELVFHDAA